MAKAEEDYKSECERRLKKLQEFCTQQFEWQEQALKKKCPQCLGPLIRADIMSVACPVCDKKYLSEQIIKGA